MANQLKKLTASNIKYLVVIKKLYAYDYGVRTTDIAKLLGVTSPSVHRMVNVLQTMNLVKKDRYGTIRFTGSGAALADRYSKHFKTICDYFNSMLPGDFDIKSVSCAVLAELSLEDAEYLCHNMNTREGDLKW